MSLDAIKTQLKTVEAGIEGVTIVFEDRPAEAPVSLNFPCIINDYIPQNFLTVTDAAFGTVTYNWHFQVKFILCAWGENEMDVWDSSIEGYPALTVGALYGALTLNGACDTLDIEGNFQIGMVKYHDQSYFGFIVPLVVRQRVNTTMAA